MMSKSAYGMLFLLCCLFARQAWAATPAAIEQALRSNKNPKQQVDTLLYLSDQQSWDSIPKSEHLTYLNKAKEIALLAGDTHSLVKVYNSYSFYHYEQDQPKTALQYLLKAIELGKSSGQAHTQALNYFNAGNLYIGMDLYSQAQEYLDKALYYYKKSGDERGLGFTHEHKALAYQLTGQLNLALQHFRQALGHFKAQELPYEMSSIYSHLAHIYDQKNDHKVSITFHKKSLKLRTQIKHDEGLANSFHNLGHLYAQTKDWSKALFYLEKAENLHKKHQLQEDLPHVLHKLGGVHMELSNYTKAKAYLDASHQTAQRQNNLDLLHQIYHYYSTYHEAQGDYKTALRYKLKELQSKDSLLNQEARRKIRNLELAYGHEQSQDSLELSQKEQKLMEQQLKLQELELSKRKGEIQIMAGFLVLSLLFGLLTYRSYLKKQTANKTLARKNREIQLSSKELRSQAKELTEKNKLIDRKNQEIQSSLRYARRIQEAILPSTLDISKHFSDISIRYRPKVEVGGDLYYFAHKPEEGGVSLLSVVDCTGHGVPGGLMSMLAKSALDLVVHDKAIKRPGHILAEVHRIIQESLSERSVNLSEGLDIALICVDPAHQHLTFSGAGLPLLFQNEKGELKHYRGEVFSIGKGNPDYHPGEFYKEHSISYIPGKSRVFLYSDGIKDQFDAQFRKKFGTPRLVNHLESGAHLGLKEQVENLFKHWQEWKKDSEQLDDVTFMGIEL